MHIIPIYAGVFIAIFFEGEMVMISSVIAAHHHYLNLWLVIGTGFLATYAADLFYFFVGRNRGKKWLQRNSALQKKAMVIQQRIEKYPVIVFVSYRFLYGLRTITPIVIGTGNIPTQKFLIYSAFSTLLWTALVTAFGMGFSSVIQSELSHIENIEKYFIGGFVVVGLILFLFFHIRRRNNNAVRK